MQRRTRNRLIAGLVGGAVLAFAVWFLRPQPILMDFGTVRVGTLEITVEEEARTQARNIYTISAPVTGKLVRSPLIAGEPVKKNVTVVAILRPTTPAFIDERSRGELRAALTAAKSAVDLAQHEVGRLEAELNLAQNHLARTEKLAARNFLSNQTLEQARRDAEAGEHALAAARAKLEVERNKHAAIEIQLGGPEDFDQNGQHELRLTAPISGEVLRVMQESESIVSAGTPIVDVADMSDLEIEADLLSADAVRVKIGAAARILDWGGPPLEARVTRLEPAGYEKTSALGIEELRVPVILEIVSSQRKWRQLKHNFRVTAQITLSRTEDALLVPTAALFRHGDGWAVFVLKAQRARIREVETGLANEAFTEVSMGLQQGEQVVLYPDERIDDGTRVAARLD